MITSNPAVRDALDVLNFSYGEGVRVPAGTRFLIDFYHKNNFTEDALEELFNRLSEFDFFYSEISLRPSDIKSRRKALSKLIKKALKNIQEDPYLYYEYKVKSLIKDVDEIDYESLKGDTYGKEIDYRLANSDNCNDEVNYELLTTVRRNRDIDYIFRKSIYDLFADFDHALTKCISMKEYFPELQVKCKTKKGKIVNINGCLIKYIAFCLEEINKNHNIYIDDVDLVKYIKYTCSVLVVNSKLVQLKAFENKINMYCKKEIPPGIISQHLKCFRDENKDYKFSKKSGDFKGLDAAS